MNTVISSIGDISVTDSIFEKYGNDDNLLEDVKAELNRGDIIIANYEFPFTENYSAGTLDTRRHLNCDVKYSGYLKNINWTMFSVGNNHIFDWGTEGIMKTKEILSDYTEGIAGAGLNEEEANRPVLVQKNGISFGIIAATKKGRVFAGRDKAGARKFDKDLLINQVTELKRKNVDHVIITVHWGVEYSSYPNPEDVESAHELIEKGASLIIGHHSHTLQGIEEYKGGLIAYNLGNFIYDMNLDTSPSKDAYIKGFWSGILRTEFSKERLEKYEFIPIVLNSRMKPVLPDKQTEKEILNHIERISGDFTADNFYRSSIDNNFKREVKAWYNRFKTQKAKGVYLFFRTLKFKHFKMIFGYIWSRMFKGEKQNE